MVVELLCLASDFTAVDVDLGPSLGRFKVDTAAVAATRLIVDADVPGRDVLLAGLVPLVVEATD